MKIQPIVEGHGEVKAVPVLLRRLLSAAQAYQVQVNRPIRRNRSEMRDEAKLRKAVRLAMLQPECAGIIVLFDADDDCPRDVAPQALAWARREAGQIPCEVAMAMREYEAWFLASLESLRGVRGIRADARSHTSPETPRDAKGELEKTMVADRSYAETIDQPALIALFDLRAAYERCRSFHHLLYAVARLLQGMGVAHRAGDPTRWL